MLKAQFTEADVAEAVRGLGATVLKPRKAPRNVARVKQSKGCLLYTSPSPRDRQKSRMPSSA